jgi:hypothetical protein
MQNSPYAFKNDLVMAIKGNFAGSKCTDGYKLGSAHTAAAHKYGWVFMQKI